MCIRQGTLQEVSEFATKRAKTALKTTNLLFTEAGEEKQFKGIATYLIPLEENMYCIRHVPLLQERFTLTVMPSEQEERMEMALYK